LLDKRPYRFVLPENKNQCLRLAENEDLLWKMLAVFSIIEVAFSGGHRNEKCFSWRIYQTAADGSRFDTGGAV
jgi:hypothetical protein